VLDRSVGQSDSTTPVERGSFAHGAVEGLLERGRFQVFERALRMPARMALARDRSQQRGGNVLQTRRARGGDVTAPAWPVRAALMRIGEARHRSAAAAAFPSAAASVKSSTKGRNRSDSSRRPRADQHRTRPAVSGSYFLSRFATFRVALRSAHRLSARARHSAAPSSSTPSARDEIFAAGAQYVEERHVASLIGPFKKSEIRSDDVGIGQAQISPTSGTSRRELCLLGSALRRVFSSSQASANPPRRN